jgi:hypothetical protein
MTHAFRYAFEPEESGGVLVQFVDVPEAHTTGATETAGGEQALDCPIAALVGYIKLCRKVPARKRVLPPFLGRSALTGGSSKFLLTDDPLRSRVFTCQLSQRPGKWLLRSRCTNARPPSRTPLPPLLGRQTSMRDVGNREPPISHASGTDSRGYHSGHSNRPFKHTYWFQEIWLENRQVFKVVIADFLLYSLALLFFSAAHFLIVLFVPNGNMQLLMETVHFWCTLVLIFVFFAVLVIEILLLAYRRLTR